MRGWWMATLLLLGCTAREGDLDRPIVDAGPLDAGPADAGLDGCPPRPAPDPLALARLGLALSTTVLEARVEVPQTTDGDLVAHALVESADRGHGFLVGDVVRVRLYRAALGFGPFPRRLILGFDGRGLPVARDDGPPELGRALIAVPAEHRRSLIDVLGYRPRPDSWAAVMEIVGDDDRVHARTVERLAGEVPDRVVFDWTASYAAAFPAPGPTRYVVTGGRAASRLPGGEWLAVPNDVRRLDAATRDRVLRALAEAAPPVDGARLAALRGRYLESWAYHLSPHVAAGEVTGLADECCTGAGGTYVGYRVVEDLRAAPVGARFVRGGHGYYTEERCSEGRILALDDLANSVEPEALVCAPAQAALETGAGTAQVRIERADSPEARAEVRGWLAAPPPVYLLWGAGTTPPAADEAGPWSTPVSATEALVLGSLVRVRVVAAREGSEPQVTLETPLAEAWYPHLDTHTFELAYRCGDPRLAEVGSEWWAVLHPPRSFGSDPEDLAGRVFLVPGALFDPEGPARNLQNLTLRMLGAPEP